MKSLSTRQFEVMDIFWKANKPMIASQIVDADPELNINTVQAVLKSLKKKGFIDLADIVYSGTVLARQYKAVITRTEYLQSLCPSTNSSTNLSNSLIAFVKQETDLRVLEELEKIIKEAKDNLKE